ncbi:hypothetical protein E2C01_088861 [Portunus trituberculatus]|uniref:Uncharacterized protein n=1 Tax=Portunus trituberculatus TaxID=210409 RepID=A0A5B7J7A2_PORTR|nr:hypothetical protein [Portunus trituberculatus]
MPTGDSDNSKLKQLSGLYTCCSVVSAGTRTGDAPCEKDARRLQPSEGPEHARYNNPPVLQENKFLFSIFTETLQEGEKGPPRPTNQVKKREKRS